MISAELFDDEVGEDFQRDVAVQQLIVRAIDEAHPSFADFGDDAVVADQLANHDRISPFRVYRAAPSRNAKSKLKVQPTRELQVIIPARVGDVRTDVMRAVGAIAVTGPQMLAPNSK
jgi:hypothetical protein